MVDVDDREREIELETEGVEDVEESDRIGAARHRRQDDVAAMEQAMAADGVEDAGDGTSGGGHIATAAPPRPRRPRSAPSSRSAPFPSRCRWRSGTPRRPGRGGARR